LNIAADYRYIGETERGNLPVRIIPNTTMKRGREGRSVAVAVDAFPCILILDVTFER
jgi:hypothetical protein